MQSLADFECLLIDNESSDSSAAIAEDVCHRDRRFRLLAATGSLPAALNTGVSRARAQLIARMDADDLSHPSRLGRQLEFFERNPHLSIVSCLVHCFSHGALSEGMRHYESWLNALRTPDEIRNALFVESPLPHPSVLMSRNALMAVGGYRDNGRPEDYDLWMRLILAGHQAAKVPEVLLYWRDTPGRLSRTHPRYRADRFVATKFDYAPRVLARDRPLQIWGAGRIGRRWSRSLRAAGFRLAGFIDVNPRKLGRRIHNVPVSAPSHLRREDGFLLAAVGARGARTEIEVFLHERGWQPYRDYLSVA